MQDVGEFEESVEPLREILEQNPGHPEANYRLGVALVRQRQSNSAIWRLERAAESPEFAEPANLALVSLYLSLKDYDRALAAADRVLALDAGAPGSPLLPLQGQPRRQAPGRRPGRPGPPARAQSRRSRDGLRPSRHARRDGALRGVRGGPSALHGGRGRVRPSPASRRVPAPPTRWPSGTTRKTPSGARPRWSAAWRPIRTTPSWPSRCSPSTTRPTETEEALALVRRRFEASPDDLSLRVPLANRLRSMGRREEAEALLVEAVEESGGCRRAAGPGGVLQKRRRARARPGGGRAGLRHDGRAAERPGPLHLRRHPPRRPGVRAGRGARRENRGSRLPAADRGAHRC